MAPDSSNPLTKAAIRVAAAGLGAAIAGPLGCALGAVIGDALGEPAAQLIGTYIEKFEEEAAKKLLETGTDSLVEKLKKSAPNLESVYRESLRLSLSEIRLQARTEWEDWFSNWDLCLNASIPLRLEEIDTAKLAPENVNDLFPRTMECLDAQGTAMRQKSLSLILKTRVAPAALIKELSARLPELFKENFRSLIVKPEYEQVWKETEKLFQDSVNALLGVIAERTEILPQMAEQTTAILEGVLDSDAKAARILEIVQTESVEDKRRIKEQDAELSVLREENRKYRERIDLVLTLLQSPGSGR